MAALSESELVIVEVEVGVPGAYRCDLPWGDLVPLFLALALSPSSLTLLDHCVLLVEWLDKEWPDEWTVEWPMEWPDELTVEWPDA